MNKTFKLVVLSAVLVFFLNLIFGRFVAAKISTWPLLNRLKILSPQAPIVINQREEIRITENGQLTEAVNAAKSKISAVYLKEASGNIRFMGSAVNLTSEGDFVAHKDVFSGRGDYVIFLEGGKNANISFVAKDPASNLAFFKASVSSVPVAPLADSKLLMSGDKVFVYSSSLSASWEAWPGYLTRSENHRAEKIYNAGLSMRSFELLNSSEQEKTRIVINAKGEVAGIVSSGEVIPSDVIKSALSAYLSNREKIVRPDYDFTFQENTGPRVEILKLPEGSLVVSSQNSALKAGDVIVSVAGQALGNGVFLEELLEKYQPGQEIELEVIRNSQTIKVKIKAKELR